MVNVPKRSPGASWPSTVVGAAMVPPPASRPDAATVTFDGLVRLPLMTSEPALTVVGPV